MSIKIENSKVEFHRLKFLILILIFACCNNAQNESPKRKTDKIQIPNTLTPEEIAGGWELLFDGATTRNWKGYNQDTFPSEGWYIDVEKNLVGESGISIVSKQQFVNFDLKLEFQMTSKTSSGIFYKIIEKPDTSILMNALEYQLIHPIYLNEIVDFSTQKHATADAYDLFSTSIEHAKPSGSWNRARIVILNNYVEHWLNDKLYLEYKIGSVEWNNAVSKSKFRNNVFYGKNKIGQIGLQYDTGIIKFRNIKIKEL